MPAQLSQQEREFLDKQLQIHLMEAGIALRKASQIVRGHEQPELSSTIDSALVKITEFLKQPGIE